MTAHRVIDDHNELSGIGDLSHPQIDSYLVSSSFIITSGSSVTPPNARKLRAGPGISITDTGPGGSVIIGTTTTVVSDVTISWMEIPSGITDGVNSQFALANQPYPATSLMLFVNGVLQRQGFSYDYLLSGQDVSLLFVPASGSNIAATYSYIPTITPITGSSMSWMEVPIGITDGVNASFDLNHEPYPTDSLMLFANGVLLRQGVGNDYLLSASNVLLSWAPALGSNIIATYSFNV